MISNDQYKRARMYNRCFLSILVLFLISFSLNCVWADSGNSIPTYFDTVEKIFVGYYQRPPSPSGLLYWGGRLNASGGNLTDIIEAFANSAESQALYGTINSSNISSVVTSVFEALFNRTPAQAGLNYYVNGFNSGQFTAATIMLNILNGAQNEDLLSVNNKLATANLFTRTIDPDLNGRDFKYYYSGNADAQRARDLLSTVTWDPATIPTGDEIKAFLVPTISYTYTILLPEGWSWARANLINDNGEVVGEGSHGGFLYSNGTYTTLLPEGWAWTRPTGINDDGEVVGEGEDASGQRRAFLYNNGTYTILLPEGWVRASADGINDNGQVVGSGLDASWQQRGFLYNNGTYTTLLPEGWTATWARGINDNGQVVGDGEGYAKDAPGLRGWGFLYSNGRYTTLPLPEGWEWTYVDSFQIQSYGQVGGSGFDASGQERGFIATLQR